MTIARIDLSMIDYREQVKERLSSEAITPGHLIAVEAAGTVKKHDVAGGVSEKLFALSNTGSAGDIDTDYAVGETVRYMQGKSGDEVYAWLDNGAGQLTVANETYLISNADGTFDVAAGTETDERTVCVALETINNDPGSVPVRIKVKLL